MVDCVNPWMLTRDAWDLAREAEARLVEVEIVCSDTAEHRARVEGRAPQIPGLRLPDWAGAGARLSRMDTPLHPDRHRAAQHRYGTGRSSDRCHAQ